VVDRVGFENAAGVSLRFEVCWSFILNGIEIGGRSRSRKRSVALRALSSTNADLSGTRSFTVQCAARFGAHRFPKKARQIGPGESIERRGVNSMWCGAPASSRHCGRMTDR